ncbi:hypothetical protein FKM82_025303 [Ascaphus truei]
MDSYTKLTWQSSLIAVHHLVHIHAAPYLPDPHELGDPLLSLDSRNGSSLVHDIVLNIITKPPFSIVLYFPHQRLRNIWVFQPV